MPPGIHQIIIMVQAIIIEKPELEKTIEEMVERAIERL